MPPRVGRVPDYHGAGSISEANAMRPDKIQLPAAAPRAAEPRLREPSDLVAVLQPATSARLLPPNLVRRPLKPGLY